MHIMNIVIQTLGHSGYIKETMASRIKVDEVTNTAGSGSVSFSGGGASFTGNVNCIR